MAVALERGVGAAPSGNNEGLACRTVNVLINERDDARLLTREHGVLFTMKAIMIDMQKASFRPWKSPLSPNRSLLEAR